MSSRDWCCGSDQRDFDIESRTSVRVLTELLNFFLTFSNPPACRTGNVSVCACVFVKKGLYSQAVCLMCSCTCLFFRKNKISSLFKRRMRFFCAHVCFPVYKTTTLEMLFMFSFLLGRKILEMHDVKQSPYQCRTILKVYIYIIGTVNTIIPFPVPGYENTKPFFIFSTL